MEAEQTRTPEKRRRRPWERAFLAALAKTGNISASCRAAKVGRTTVHDAVQNWPDFKAEYDVAYEEAMDALEEEARRRAHDGLTRYKFDKKGEPLRHPLTGEPYCEHEYSDTLLIFLLKGGRPEKYRERHDHEHTGKGGGPIQYANLTDDELDRRIAELEGAIRQSPGREESEAPHLETPPAQPPTADGV